MNIQEFFTQFPDDEACLEHLMVVRYGREAKCPSCKRETKFHRILKRPVYSCQFCGHQIYPMAGTPFQDSHTPLQKWFYAMYLFTTSRHGVPAKELQRQLSLTYKTAWRMAHVIREYMGAVDGNDKLQGDVEVDETLIGGHIKGQGYQRHSPKKTIVMGMVERGGEVMTKVVNDCKRKTLFPIIKENVHKLSKVHTDDATYYQKLSRLGYIHDTVAHGEKEYVRGNAYTNTIEGFWSQLKRSIKGTHIHVSRKHLPKYLGEFEFRYNRRNSPISMMDELLMAF